MNLNPLHLLFVKWKGARVLENLGIVVKDRQWSERLKTTNYWQPLLLQYLAFRINTFVGSCCLHQRLGGRLTSRGLLSDQRNGGLLNSTTCTHAVSEERACEGVHLHKGISINIGMNSSKFKHFSGHIPG